MNNGPFAAFENLGVRGCAARPDLPILDGEVLDAASPPEPPPDTCPECGGDDVETCLTCARRWLDTPCEVCGATPDASGCLCDDGGDL